MATIFTHPLVPVAIAMVLGQKRIPKPLWQAGMVAAVVPDFDCASFILKIPYESQFGHRGFMHSFVFAAAFAALWAWRNMEFKVDGETPKRWVIFAYIFACTSSHGILDAFTDGGQGVAFFWPFTAERYFFPARPLLVSPIGQSFFSDYGLAVFLAELKLVWLPCLLIGMLGVGVRKMLEKRTAAK